MPNYRRALVPGASWFFTVNLLERRGTAVRPSRTSEYAFGYSNLR